MLLNQSLFIGTMEQAISLAATAFQINFGETQIDPKPGHFCVYQLKPAQRAVQNREATRVSWWDC